ncbi:MAG: amidase [Pseudomonadota bacterium]
MATKRRDFLKAATIGSAVALTGGCDGNGEVDIAPRLSGAKPGDDRAAPISVNTIAEAEKLQGVSYTDSERRQMLHGLERKLEQWAVLRAETPANSAPPAQVFSPKLPRQRIRSQKNRFSFYELQREPFSEMRFPEAPEDIAYADVKTLGAMVRAGVLTSAALTEIYLQRIERYNPTLRAFITVSADLAREQAEKADKDFAKGRDRGPLHGIPYAVKDIIDTRNIPTTWGAALYRDRVPDKDAEVVVKLKRAGAVLLGKTSCGALAYGDQWFDGRTRNPWNPKEGANGSSAGSAAAVVAGLCGFALGTETLGSIISPSERCGAVGLRPTFGRVTRAGVMTLAWSLDKVGPLARRAEDTAAVLSALNGYDADDPAAARMGFTYDGGVDLSSLTVGYVPAWFEAGDETDRTALAAVRDSGVRMVEFDWPARRFDALIEIVQVEAAAAFADLTLSGEDDALAWQEEAAWPNTWRAARFVSAVDYVQIDRLRRQLMTDLAEAFNGVDVLIGPHFAGGALLATNCTGHPQMAVPVGSTQTPSRDLWDAPIVAGAGETFQTPRGVSLWGALFNEGPMIAVARALETALGVSSRRPPGF